MSYVTIRMGGSWIYLYDVVIETSRLKMWQNEIIHSVQMMLKEIKTAALVISNIVPRCADKCELLRWPIYVQPAELP